MTKIFKKSIVFITILTMCVVTGCAERSYSATASILVANGAVTTSYEDTTGKIASSDISASLYLAYTVVDVLNTPDIYKEVAEQLDKSYSYQSLMDNISVTRRSEDTLFIDITFTGINPEEAVLVVNKFAEVTCDYIPDFIPSARVRIASVATKAVKKGIFSK